MGTNLATMSARGQLITPTLRDREESGPPLLVIEGGRGRLRVSSLRELWAYREVVWAFAVRFVKVKYKQAAIGVGWSVLQPLLLAALFALFLGRYGHVQSEGEPYLLFALAGFVAWSFFATAAGSAMESLVNDQALLRKVYFPREVVPMAAVMAALIDLVPGIATLLVVTIAFGVAPGLTWVAFPIPILILIATALAFGLGLSGLNVYYRDVRHALPFLLQVMLFASPVIYPLSQVPAGLRTVYAIVNPIASAVDGVRRVGLRHMWPDWSTTLAALGWACVLCVLAYALFKRLERGFADRV